ncbi:MAG: lipid-A-disaccharide synthase [Pseudomonadota bacterium]|jgi:lipid-A-disaccharide synthase
MFKRIIAYIRTKDERQMQKLLVSALEPSANLHLETYLKEHKDVVLRGVFDKSLGMPDVGSHEFSVMGFLDVIGKLMLARSTIKKLVEISKECDEVLLIDAPAFNIPLAKAIKEANKNVKVTYYILPKVWAWKSGRIKTVNKFTDEQAYIFPFENRYWKNGTYVGNPLLKQIKNFKESVTKDGAVAFLPGSRKSEIRKLMPIFNDVAKNIVGEKVIVIPKHFDDETIALLYGDLSAYKIMRDAREVLYEAKEAVVCSGTATLEAALIGTPFVLVYKASPIDEWIVRRFVKLKYAGLANILFDFEGREIMHAELLQEAVNAKNILEELRKIDPQSFLDKSFELRKLLA